MDDRSTVTRERLKLVLFLMFFAFSVFLNLRCSQEDNPAADPACGTGHVYWDEKNLKCRDQSDGHVIPDFCCGR